MGSAKVGVALPVVSEVKVRLYDIGLNGLRKYGEE